MPDSSADFDIYTKRADGSGEAELLLSVPGHAYQPAPQPNGQALAYTLAPGNDVWIAPEEGEPVRFLETPFHEHAAVFSPDGRFLALVSDESGQNEVYVHAYPDAHRRWTISSAGGTEPTWSADGSELFYRNRDAMMVVALETEPELDPSVPRALFRKAFRMSAVLTNYDVSSDGQRFVMAEGGDETTEIRVVVNWFEELERIAPSRK